MKLNPLILPAAVILAGYAHAATITNPTIVSGPGNIIDPPGGETVDQSFGTAETTLEARSDLRALQSFTGFTAGDNVVSFSSTTLPDIQFVRGGSFGTASGQDITLATANTVFGTSNASAIQLTNSAASTSSTLTINFGTWNGTTFDGNETVGAAGFTLNNAFAGRNGTVTFRDAAGTALHTAFAYTGVINADANSNHKDFYFGWDSTEESTAAIGSILITMDQGATTGSIGLDDLAFTTIPEPSAALLGGLGMLALLRRRRA